MTVPGNCVHILRLLFISTTGQLILTSWGYKADLPYDNDKLMHFGNKLKQKIEETSGRLYTVGSAGAIFYAAGWLVL